MPTNPQLDYCEICGRLLLHAEAAHAHRTPIQDPPTGTPQNGKRAILGLAPAVRKLQLATPPNSQQRPVAAVQERMKTMTNPLPQRRLRPLEPPSPPATLQTRAGRMPRPTTPGSDAESGTPNASGRVSPSADSDDNLILNSDSDSSTPIPASKKPVTPTPATGNMNPLNLNHSRSDTAALQPRIDKGKLPQRDGPETATQQVQAVAGPVAQHSTASSAQNDRNTSLGNPHRLPQVPSEIDGLRQQRQQMTEQMSDLTANVDRLRLRQRILQLDAEHGRAEAEMARTEAATARTERVGEARKVGWWRACFLWGLGLTAVYGGWRVYNSPDIQYVRGYRCRELGLPQDC